MKERSVGGEQQRVAIARAMAAKPGGAVLGGVLGQLLPFDMEGIDFCMTALFVIIFIDQWEKTRKHIPAVTGLGIGILCIVIFGQKSFMLPALLITSGILVIMEKGGKIV